VEIELRALNPINQKRKRIDQGTPSESVNQKKPFPAPPKSHPAARQSPIANVEKQITPLLNAE